MNEDANTLPGPSRWSAVRAYARKHIAPRWPNLLLIFLKNTVGALLAMVPPALSKYVLEAVLPSRDLGWLTIVAVCMVAAPIAGSAMIVAEVRAGRFMEYLTGQGRARLYDGLQRRPLDEPPRDGVGGLLARLLDDTDAIGTLANGNIGFLFYHVVTILVGSAVLLSLHPGLAAVVLPLWAGQAALMAALGPRIKRRAAEAARRGSRVAETVREIVSAAPFLKAAGQETKALDTLRSSLREEWSHIRRGALTDHRMRQANAALNAAILVLMYAAGGWFALHDRMTVGSLVAFVAVYNWLRPFGAQMIAMSLAAVKVLPAVDRVAEIAYPTADEGGGIVPQGPVELAADRLAYHYGDRHRPALHNVSFRAAPGSFVAVVGHRGSGKSTLADLLLGLRQPSSGIVSASGVPLPLVDPAWLHSRLLCVTQDTMLRSGTIADNVLYGSPDADPAAVREAIRLAELEEWLSRLPDGLSTRVGERGLQLSGGERQRIGIARALLRRPSVLVLDEATSALDAGTEHRLLRGLTGRLTGCTLIFITHRLAVAKQADRIIVMEDGTVAEAGTYAELLAGPTRFRRLCEHAASEFSARQSG